jgi:hypothetical protein
MDKRWNKSGQFFLISAVVIIVVIVSVITISNYTSKKDEVKLYDLGQEMGIESQQVIDSGTYSGLSDEEMATLMENFAKNYVNYIEEDKNIYFIFGNQEQVHVLGYQEVQAEDVCVRLNQNPADVKKCLPTELIEMGKTTNFPSVKGSLNINKVIIRIGDTDYQFNLKSGENFYFVIWEEIKGEKHVVTSNPE